MPKRNPLQLPKNQTPATGRRNTPPTTNIMVRTNPARSPAQTNTAQKSSTRGLARSPARKSAVRRRNLERESSVTMTRLGRISPASPARSEPAPPSMGGALTASIIYRNSNSAVRYSRHNCYTPLAWCIPFPVTLSKM